VYLTAEEVAELLRVSPKTVYRLALKDPSLPCLRVGGVVRFPEERLLRWLRDREQGRPICRQARSAAKPAPQQGAA